jgi:predicted metal-dependent hydrolase
MKLTGWLDRVLGLVTHPSQGQLFQTDYAHPRSNRRLMLQGHAVGFLFERTRRRSIGMLVGPEGLVVRAPRWVSLADVDQAVQEREAWIVRHLQQAQERAKQESASKVQWADGVSVAYLGQPLRVRLNQGLPHEALVEDAPPAQLHLALPQDVTAQAIRDATHAWLQRQAALRFQERVAHFAPRLNVHVTRLALSAARTRWGSAGADGSVRLNWRLIHHDTECIDYVVVHELSHLRHMNHSPAFWRVVGSQVPNYLQVRARLQAHSHDIQD